MPVTIPPQSRRDGMKLPCRTTDQPLLVASLKALTSLKSISAEIDLRATPELGIYLTIEILKRPVHFVMGHDLEILAKLYSFLELFLKAFSDIKES